MSAGEPAAHDSARIYAFVPYLYSLSHAPVRQLKPLSSELLKCGIMWAGLTHDAPHMLIALGAPFSQIQNTDGYWRSLYRNIKGRLAKWARLVVAQNGRLLV